jgi:hypothetical protein
MERLLDMSLGTHPPAGCSLLENILLPCSKLLWEADTKAKWECEYKKYLSERKSSGLLVTRSLWESAKFDVSSVEADTLEDLSSWSKGVDGFGALLIMAV